MVQDEPLSKKAACKVVLKNPRWAPLPCQRSPKQLFVARNETYFADKSSHQIWSLWVGYFRKSHFYLQFPLEDYKIIFFFLFQIIILYFSCWILSRQYKFEFEWIIMILCKKRKKKAEEKKRKEKKKKRKPGVQFLENPAKIIILNLILVIRYWSLCDTSKSNYSVKSFSKYRMQLLTYRKW